MRITISEFISLDGVVQAPGGAEEDTEGGFRHGGWSMPFFDPEVMGGHIDGAAQRADALLFGRRTWQVMAGAWPERAESGDDDPFTKWINSVDKYVVSDTLTDADLRWGPTTLGGGKSIFATDGAARTFELVDQNEGPGQRRADRRNWRTASGANTTMMMIVHPSV